MSYSYDKRRASQVGHEGQQLSGRTPMGTFLPDAANSAQLAMLGLQDTRGGAADLKAAMDAKAASLIGPISDPLGRFGPDHEDARAEAEADRIGNRFSGASGVQDLKSRMGSALGADFTNVRFHSGAEAAAMASSADAEAFTTGRDIYMGGPFNAATAAHEMVHTIQQGAVEASAPVMSAPAGAVQYKHKRTHTRRSSTQQGPAVVRPVPAASVRAAAGQTAQPARTPVVRPVPPASVRAAAGQNTQGQPGTPPPVPPRPEFLRRRTSNP